MSGPDSHTRLQIKRCESAIRSDTKIRSQHRISLGANEAGASSGKFFENVSNNTTALSCVFMSEIYVGAAKSFWPTVAKFFNPALFVHAVKFCDVDDPSTSSPPSPKSEKIAVWSGVSENVSIFSENFYEKMLTSHGRIIS